MVGKAVNQNSYLYRFLFPLKAPYFSSRCLLCRRPCGQCPGLGHDCCRRSLRRGAPHLPVAPCGRFPPQHRPSPRPPYTWPWLAQPPRACIAFAGTARASSTTASHIPPATLPLRTTPRPFFAPHLSPLTSALSTCALYGIAGNRLLPRPRNRRFDEGAVLRSEMARKNMYIRDDPSAAKRPRVTGAPGPAAAIGESPAG